MGSTADRTFKVAYSLGFRDEFECDGATVSCKLLDANGVPTGANLDLSIVAPTTTPAMTQWHPGLFTYTTTNLPLTRGSRYRATYIITVGGATAETVTQDFTAESDLTTAADQTTFHRYTCLMLRDTIRRALGLADSDNANGAQEPGSATTLEMVNDTLQNLWREHRWMFQTADRRYIDFVANQHRYELPREFMELISVAKRDDLIWKFIPKPLAWLRNQREGRTPTPGYVTYYTILSDPTDDFTSETRFVLEIWPTPTSFEQAGMVLDFNRECPRVLADADIVPVPLGYQSLLKQAVRSEAFEQENDEKAEPERLKFERMLAHARRHDSRHGEQNLGSMIERRSARDDSDAVGIHDPYGDVE